MGEMPDEGQQVGGVPFNLSNVPISHGIMQIKADDGTPRIVMMFATPVGTFGFIYDAAGARDLARLLNAEADKMASTPIIPRITDDDLARILRPNGG